jgi:hypothetical protein
VRLNVHLFRAALVILFLVSWISCAFAADAPKRISYWGIVISDTGGQGQGVAIVVVNNDSPAGKAGLKPGDVLLSINGVAVRSAQEFRVVKNTFPLYTPLKLAIKRNNVLVECQILLHGIVPLEVKAVKSEFTIPGVPPPPPSTVLSAIDALEVVNVLDQVILDPGSGKIAIIGHYDARFNTGPIPYLDILKTAMSFPKPVFNLDSSSSSDQSLAATKQRLWDWPTKESVLGHPDLEQERQLLIRDWASACGLSPEELVALFNYVNFAVKEVVPPWEIRAIQGKILTNLGFAEAAQAYNLVNQTGADAPLKALQLLGRNAEAQSILARSGGDAAKGRGALSAAVYLAIMEKIYVPEDTIASLRDELTQGSSTWQEVVIKAQGLLMPGRSSADKRDIVMAALNKIMLSTKGSKALLRIPLEGQTLLRPENLDRTSQLTRILYEADYSLKSLVVMPQLFRHIKGSMSNQEYEIHKREKSSSGIVVSTEHWLEPQLVSMTVSPKRRVVSFGLAQMKYDTRTYTGNEPVGDGAINHFYDEWCAGVMDNFDEYARIMPAFHKVREAAKVIALANWLIAEKVPVDLRGISQEKWDVPDKVPGFWRVGFSYSLEKDNGTGVNKDVNTIQIAYSGGVTFKRSNWTRMTPAPTSETGVTDQLTLSAGLGQKAVQAAQAGNLEQARNLAELSAQAMTGALSKTGLAKLNIVMPEAKPAPVSPANVQLQKEMIKKTHQQIVALGQNPSSRGTATSTLAQLNSLYDQVRDKPAAASDYLLQLQTGKLPPPAMAQTTAAKPPTDTVCGESSLGETTLSAEREEYLTKRLSEARDRLRHINEALKKLIAINAAQRAEIDKLTAEITEQYNKAQDRAWDVVFDLTTSISLDAFGAEQVKRVKGIEDAIQGKIALKTTPLDAAGLQKVEEEIKLLQSAKFRMEEAYASTEKLIALFKGANYGKEIDKWQRENQGAYERAKTSVSLLGNLALDHPALEKWLSKKPFFYGETLWQVAAMGRMAYYAWGFYADILAQRAVWEPVTNKLQNELQYNMQGMEYLRQRAEQTSQQIRCLEKLLP